MCIRSLSLALSLSLSPLLFVSWAHVFSPSLSNQFDTVVNIIDVCLFSFTIPLFAFVVYMKMAIGRTKASIQGKAERTLKMIDGGIKWAVTTRAYLFLLCLFSTEYDTMHVKNFYSAHSEKFRISKKTIQMSVFCWSLYLK